MSVLTRADLVDYVLRERDRYGTTLAEVERKAVALGQYGVADAAKYLAVRYVKRDDQAMSIEAMVDVAIDALRERGVATQKELLIAVRNVALGDGLTVPEKRWREAYLHMESEKGVRRTGTADHRVWSFERVHGAA